MSNANDPQPLENNDPEPIPKENLIKIELMEAQKKAANNRAMYLGKLAMNRLAANKAKAELARNAEIRKQQYLAAHPGANAGKAARAANYNARVSQYMKQHYLGPKNDLFYKPTFRGRRSRRNNSRKNRGTRKNRR